MTSNFHIEVTWTTRVELRHFFIFEIWLFGISSGKYIAYFSRNQNNDVINLLSMAVTAVSLKFISHMEVELSEGMMFHFSWLVTKNKSPNKGLNTKLFRCFRLLLRRMRCNENNHNSLLKKINSCIDPKESFYC